MTNRYREEGQKYSTNVPLARRLLRENVDLLRKIGARDAAQDIENIITQCLTQSPPLKNAPAQRRSLESLSEGERDAIVRMARANPDMTNRAIGARFGVDGGRVSEAMRNVNKS